MSRATRILLFLLLLGGSLAIGVAISAWPRSQRSIHVTDVTKPFSASARAPIRPLGNGVMYVLVEGHLDGEAVLEISSGSSGRVTSMTLQGSQIAESAGYDEMWVDDVQVRYRPGTAKTGELYVALYCGVKLSATDRERYHRILRIRQK